MNLEQAKALLPFVAVAERDLAGLPVRLVVPAQTKFVDGRRGGLRTATVRISRDKAVFTLHCEICGSGDAAEPEACMGMSKGHLCYHSLAAVIASAAEVGALYFWSDEGRAKEYAEKRGGKVLVVRSAYSDGKIASSLAVFVPSKKHTKPTPQVVHQEKATKQVIDSRIQCTCGKPLVTPEQRESGLCSACDKSFPSFPQPLPVRLS